MRHTKLFAALLASAAVSAPVFAWAVPDCGNQPAKTAEAVYTIQTPQQALAPTVEVVAPVNVETFRPAPTTAPNPVVTYEAAPSPAVTYEAAPNPVVTYEAAPQAVAQPVKTAQVAAPQVHSPAANYEAILQRRISRGSGGLNLFDYAGAKAAGEGRAIKAYTDYLAAQNPDTFSQNDQIAYWANLYNALTVSLILDNYPVKSIRKIKAGALSNGPWKRDEVTVNGKVLSLNDIEHEILRKRYPNPAMVHYMVNCASIGCPNLPSKLWVGATLDADRAAAAREFINSPRGVEIRGNGLKASSIYNWFKEDFGGSKSATINHFRQFAGPELRAALDAGAKISGYGYNWDLNE